MILPVVKHATVRIVAPIVRDDFARTVCDISRQDHIFEFTNYNINMYGNRQQKVFLCGQVSVSFGCTTRARETRDFFLQKLHVSTRAQIALAADFVALLDSLRHNVVAADGAAVWKRNKRFFSTQTVCIDTCANRTRG
jgi:hypothetical protein